MRALKLVLRKKILLAGVNINFLLGTVVSNLFWPLMVWLSHYLGFIHACKGSNDSLAPEGHNLKAIQVSEYIISN